MKRAMKKPLSFLTALAVLCALTVPAFAVNTNQGSIGDITPDQEHTQSYTYDAPTAPMAVDDSIITATAHRAASPVLGMMGVNATSGFGMINGSAPSDLASAMECSAMGIWGSSLNSNPDPYYWNYFYNFYAAENGLELSEDALINANVAASPGQADGNLQEEYGNVSYSLATRPQIAVGVASAASGASTDGYDEQLATIHSFTADSPYYHEGDETYSPKLVSYQMTRINDMMASVQRLADAITEVEQETGKTTRYGDVQVIASDYEKYVYATIAYVQEELAAKGLEEKTVAVVTQINEDGTYTIADVDTLSATSTNRPFEYTMNVTKSLGETYGTSVEQTSTGRDGKETTTTVNVVTLDELLSADAIVIIGNTNIPLNDMLESFGNNAYDGIIVSNTPASLYGVTMNSVENAVGYAFVISTLYCDEIDIDPVEMCAYFYEHFLHITDRAGLEKVVLTNFSETVLPEGVGTTLPADYSAAKVEAKLTRGINYYLANRSAFQDEEDQLIGLDAWDPDLTVGIGSGASASEELPFTDVEQGQWYTDAITWAYGNGMVADDGSHTFGLSGAAPRSEVVTALWKFNGSPEPTIANPFSNVSESDPYYQAVLWAYEKGITTGSSASVVTFNTAACTRSEMVTFLYRAAGSPAVSGENAFTDLAGYEWCADAVQWAVANGITNGTNAAGTTFNPERTLTRSEVYTFLYKANT